jgi:hypothetical protein
LVGCRVTSSSCGLIDVTITDTGGLRTGWTVNGLDIAENATSLPASGPLMAQDLSWQNNSEAIARTGPGLRDIAPVLDIA